FALGHEATQGAPDGDVEIDFAPAAAPTRDTRRKGEGRQGAGPDTAGRTKKKKRLDEPTEWLFVSAGRGAGITPGDLVGALTGETDLKGRDIGAITVHEGYSLVEVPEKLARKAVKSLNRCSIKGHRVKVRLDRGR
ncbi:MAG: DbpA RNA binding domain-containing protein, partial [bacterium]